MKFIGQKRTIQVDANYSQMDELGEFWNEMRTRFPSDELFGLTTNWAENTMDYYIGKIDERLDSTFESVDIPDQGWHEFSCEDSDEEIQKMYRQIYQNGKLDYEIESIKNGQFITKVHYAKKENA